MKRVLVVALALAGCAYGTPRVELPSGAPQFTDVDIEASEVTLHDDASDITVNESVDARRDIADVLRDAKRQLPNSTTPSRFRAKVTLKKPEQSKSQYVCVGVGVFVAAFVTCPLFYVLGATTDDDRIASVEITVETPNGAFTGHGEGEGQGGLYASARRRALARAVAQAMAKVTTAIRASNAGM